ncbi:ArsR/SmtB family transcription factor [Arthrobacter sp. Hor0625]|uniref:ArsR/SmtB family transcription factor n=1 Tax=Arthrobacter sp. Hor0625 TaxID=3457358 RepID=UPI00403EADEF
MSSQPEHAATPAAEQSLVHDVAPGPQLLEAAAGTLRMLAEPARLHLLWQLADGPKTVTELTAASAAPRTVVSQVLRYGAG